MSTRQYIIVVLLTVLLGFQATDAKSKPVDGFSLYLLGQPDKDSAWANLIPQGESAVYSLCETQDHGVLGGTCVRRGKMPWLFYFDAKTKIIGKDNLLPLGMIIPGQSCVTALAMGSDSAIYGALSNLWDLDYKYEDDVKNSNYEGGHLFKAVVVAGKISLKDLGAPFKGEGIVALAPGKSNDVLYGVTAPSQILFGLDVASGKARELGRLPELKKEFRRYVSKTTKSLVADDSGNIYGSASGGRLFKYSPKSQKLDTLFAVLPTEGEGGNYDGATAFVRTKAGRIFGGNFLDGKLFELFPKTGKVREFGLTSRTGNLTGLTEKEGVLYGTSGSETSGSKFFAYNIATGEFHSFPGLRVYYENTEKKIKWTPHNFKNLILMKNGMLVTGENDQPGRFYTYEVQPIDWAK